MKIQRSIKLLDVNGSNLPASLLGEVEEDRIRECHLTISCQEFEVKATGMHFFEALIKVRELLEKRGLKVVCYGACKGVCPSGMDIDMNLGLSGYRHSENETKRILDIFDAGDDMDVVTVEEQHVFIKDLRQRLRQP